MNLTRQYVLFGLCGIGVGLSSCAKNTETQVIEWLAAGSYPAEFDTLHNRKPLWTHKQFDRWIERGRHIEGAEPVLRKMLEDMDPRINKYERPVFALTWIGNSNSVPVLLKALTHTNEHVRREAARALGKIGDNRAVEPLCILLKQDQDYNVRGNVALALGDFAGEEAIPALKEALNDEGGDGIIRALVAESLAKVYHRVAWDKIKNRTPKANSAAPKEPVQANSPEPFGGK